MRAVGKAGGLCGVFGILMALSACAPAPATMRMPRPAVKARSATIRVQVKEGTALVVREVPIEEYVTATALSEVHPDVSDEAIAERVFEVQAVIARTYAMANRGRHAREGFDLCSTTHCQLYEPSRLTTSRWAAAAREAVSRTAGEVLWFAGAPANALFHADCGGQTSSATAVWGGPSPAYLAGTPDRCPATHVEWTFEATATALRAALNRDPRTAVGARLDRVEIAARDAGGRAEMVTLRGSRTFVVRGDTFREVVSRALGVKSIRSTLFNVRKTSHGFTFTGKGYGHGVGLCQAGALARLRSGTAVDDVLTHYFPGVGIRVARP